MQTFTSVVRCATCKRVLAKAAGIPGVQEDLTQAAEAATRVVACPERGHMRNSNLDFEWLAEPPGSPIAANPPRVIPGPAVASSPVASVTPANTQAAPLPPVGPTTYATEDELLAALAAEEAAAAVRPPETLEVTPAGSTQSIPLPIAIQQQGGVLGQVVHGQVVPGHIGQTVHFPLPPEAPAVPLAEGSSGFNLAHERLDEHEAPGNAPPPEAHDPNETSELARSLANGAE
jgi:hypothetical protein